jgi:hypothetical protein
MNTPALTPSAPLDPELSLFARFLRWIAPAAPVLSAPVLVRIGRNGRGGWALYPVNAAARALLCVEGDGYPHGETGNFATPADAARRAQWNAWDIAAP